VPEGEAKRSLSEKINRWRFATIFYVAILFGGVILADIVISQVFNLPGEAAQSLTENVSEGRIGGGCLRCGFRASLAHSENDTGE
jgi:hypothetical protein